MPPILRLLRPHQYVKNVFVLVGVLFAHRWEWMMLWQALLAFAAFCSASSAVYVVNDLHDVEADRAHPVKRRRPLASGAVSRRAAIVAGSVMAGLALVLAATAGPVVLGLIVAYVVLNLLYTWRFKQVVILDVFFIAAGFMLRILAGTWGLGIEPSAWLLLCGLMLTLFLGFIKRRAELITQDDAADALGQGSSAAGPASRKVLADYSPALLDQIIAIAAASVILSYGLYTVSPQTVAVHGTDRLIYTLPFVVYGILRYLYLLHRQSGGNDAAQDVVSDPHLVVILVGWLAVTIFLLA